MTTSHFDIVVVGGGINGAGIAADAAGRGLSVLLVEAADLGGATSSASSKLIHGGLRYLEHFEFRLVREALAEREVLLEVAPHLIRPLRFVLPHVAGMRSKLALGAGLALYDRLAERRLIPASSRVDLRRDPAGRPLKPALADGFAYWDCWVDDARLVIGNARLAADRGAEILVGTRLEDATRTADGRWTIRLAGPAASRAVTAAALVNAAGPWAEDVARIAMASGASGAQTPPRLRLVKGSHIVVPRIAGADDAYLMQSGDGRVVFALPFEGRFTLVGTTDEAYRGDPRQAAISAAERDYLIAILGQYFVSPPSSDDIVATFAGVRPLVDDGSAKASKVSRDYRIDLVGGRGDAPLVNVIGGKITTYRRLAEAVMDKLAPSFPAMGRPWTASARLPGSEVGSGGIEAFTLDFARRRSWLPAEAAARLVRLYGTRADVVLGDAASVADLGAPIGGGLTEREVAYLAREEWARTAEDVLWRRTKAGLVISAADRAEVALRIDGALAQR